MSLSILVIQNDAPKDDGFSHQFSKISLGGRDCYSYTAFRTILNTEVIKIIFNKKRRGVFSTKKLTSIDSDNEYVKSFLIHLTRLRNNSCKWAKHINNDVMDSQYRIYYRIS